MQRPDTNVQCTLHGAYFDFCTGSIKTFIESTNYIPILHHYGKSCFWHSVSRHSIYQYIKQLNFQYNIHLNLHHIQLEKVFRNVKKYISTKFQNDLLVKISSHDLFNLPVKTSIQRKTNASKICEMLFFSVTLRNKIQFQKYYLVLLDGPDVPVSILRCTWKEEVLVLLIRAVVHISS